MTARPVYRTCAVCITPIQCDSNTVCCHPTEADYELWGWQRHEKDCEQAADAIRGDQGEHWLVVAMAAHLADARERGEWSFGHDTLRLWLDHRSGLVDEDEYREWLAQIAADAMRQHCPMM